MYVHHCYAHGRDPAGGRPWLRRADSLNSALSWMIQHEADLFALTRTLTPEPAEWPAMSAGHVDVVTWFVRPCPKGETTAEAAVIEV